MRQTLLSKATYTAFFFCLLLAFILNGCQADQRPRPAMQKQAPVSSTPYTPQERSESANKQSATTTASATARKVIQRAQMSLQIKKYEAFSQNLQSSLKNAGGYIADLQLSRSLDRISSARIALRIPSPHFSKFLEWVRHQGNITHEHISGEDITSQYFDLEARLRNQQRTEQRLLQLLQEKTSSLKDVVAVERELGRVREQIERFEGQKRMWDRLVEMATLNLNLYISYSLLITGINQ